MRAWHLGSAIVAACASATACAAVLGFDASPELSVYNYMGDTDGGHWQESTLDHREFQGGVFDGRYVYLPPTLSSSNRGAVERYDTQSAFALASWVPFVLSGIGSAAQSSFGGAVFDGRYVYLVPQWGGMTKVPTHPIVVRYDTTAPYESDSSWEAFDVTENVSKDANGFAGGTFDGRYVYFVPFPNTYAVRFDTHGSFSSKGSWDVFHIATIDKAALGAQGAIFDGRYVYFIPSTDAELNANDGLVRYDNRKSFTDDTAWESVHLSIAGFNPDALGFAGGAFDGRYVYLAPYESYLGTVARFDTTAPGGLKSRASWSFFSVQENVNKNGSGFCGAGFDGRFVYFVPNDNVMFDGLVVRLDSLGDFEDKRSWSAYDMASINPAAKGFCGAVFDGQSMYFVPTDHAFITRFEARTSPQMPKLPGFFGSFF